MQSSPSWIPCHSTTLVLGWISQGVGLELGRAGGGGGGRWASICLLSPSVGQNQPSPGTSLTSPDLHQGCFLILLDQAEKNRKNH